MKVSTKTYKELFTKKRNKEKERKRALYNLRMPKLHENFTTVAIATRDSLFCKMFSPLHRKKITDSHFWIF